MSKNASAAFRVAVGGIFIFCMVCSGNLRADEMVVQRPARKAKTQTLGWVERVRIVPWDLEVEAKLAPAVPLSALHAEDVVEFQKNGKPYARFQMEDRHGKTATLEVPVVDSKRTKTAKGTKYVRQVVKILICLSGKKVEAEVLLADRSELEQELRLGRNVLAGQFLIDPARTHVSKPQCEG